MKDLNGLELTVLARMNDNIETSNLKDKIEMFGQLITKARDVKNAQSEEKMTGLYYGMLMGIKKF